jgi:Asp-tRNA(Asn)/Glu-tRNA(Gln) amidotransferase A subunit family amidase
MDTPRDLLEQTQDELEQVAEEVEHYSGIDRREFVYMSLVAAAATTLGAHAARAQGGAAAAAGAAPQQTPPTPFPLGNGEPPAEQFMPYPGGTGALMEKMVKEHGAKAFDRSAFTVDKWSGAVPTSDDDIAFLPAHRLSAMIKEKKITSVRLTTIYLERLKRLNPKLLCAVTIIEQAALAEAAQMDAELKAGKYRGPLHGIPYGVKDLFIAKGTPTTWGSADFVNRTGDEDSEVVARLRAAGAVLIAKLSTGLYAQGDQWFGGRTNNPWNMTHPTLGGSSGSSAGPSSATAAGCVAFGIGTETQGSIVSPSVRCGLTALRPTFGRVSRYGGMVLGWTMDRVGPICRNAEDCAMVFNVIHGVDTKDPSTVMTPFHFDPNIKLSSLRIGVDPGRAAGQGAPDELVAKLKELGMQPKEIGARPVVPGVGGGMLELEDAAAFDEIVQRKAKEIGLDLNALPVPGAGGGGGGGGGRGNPPVPIHASSAPNNPGAAGSDWDPRFVRGRSIRALDFIQNQRRRYVMITQWAAFMKDLDMFIGNPNADVGPNAQTGHPRAVVPYKFDVPVVGGGRGGAAATTPAPELNKQPICAVITGNLYNDDLILSVAHLVQKATDFHLQRPKL